MRSDLKNSAMLKKRWADGEGVARAEARDYLGGCPRGG